MYEDRLDAARRLERALRGRVGPHPLVLAIAGGGAPMGRFLADALGGDFDVLLVQKLSAPDNPGRPVGAVAEDGALWLRPWAERWMHPGSLETEAKRQVSSLRQRRLAFDQIQPAYDPAGRHVLVVDDGAVTGATMLAALGTVHMQKPKRLVCAIGVGSPDTIEELLRVADDVVCPFVTSDLVTVGQFYHRYDVVPDERIGSMLAGGLATSP